MVQLAALRSSLVIAVALVASLTAQQSVWTGVYTTAQATEGAALYRAHCASCHGETLGGAEAVPALIGTTFSATWEGVSLFDLFERIRTTMPPGKPAVMARSGYATVLAYLLHANGIPAGEQSLGSDKAALGALRYTSYKP